jgi:hypothetical protein
VLLDRPISWRDLSEWKSVHTLFLGWNIAKMAAFTAVNVLDTAIPVVQPFAFGAVLYVLARTSLVLPAAAVGESPLPLLSWDRSENNGWRLAMLRVMTWASLALALSPVLVPVLVLVGREFRMTHHVTALQCLPLWFLAFLMIPLGSSTVALAYRALRDYRPADSVEGT